MDALSFPLGPQHHKPGAFRRRQGERHPPHLFCAESPGAREIPEDAGIRLLWHPAPSVETGAQARAILEDPAEGRVGLDILCVEGAGAGGRFQMRAGTGGTMLDWVRRLSARARHVVAVGTCAAYGGVTAAG